jgi:peptidoglycan/LPS O-acetylase OafA/YrhL
MQVTSYRPFLDGLRALAVGAVLVYHLDNAWLPGGYLGVDVFFVLSGYLITGLLVAEHERRGRVDLPAFWARRVRRLLPALIVMLFTVFIALQIGGDDLSLASARGDFLSALFYVANWHFVASGQSYFEQYTAISPLRHTWSLGIEEQFYLAWPIVTWFILRKWGRVRLGVAAATIAVASFVLMASLYSATDPSRAYYGTDTRIGELLIGAVLAVVLAGPARARLLGLARPLAIPALVGLLAAMVGLAATSALYYGPGAAAFALAVAVLIAGLEAGGPLTGLFSLRPMVGLGLISYGVYLWHFPVIQLINGLGWPTSTLLPAAAAIAITLGVSLASFVVVERPIRRRLPPWPDLTPRRLVRLVPAVSGVLALGIVAMTPATPPLAFTDSGLVLPSSPASGPSTITIGVVGDSVMVSALPGFSAEASRRGWRLASGATAACPIGPGPLFDATGKPSPYNERCAAVPQRQAAVLGATPTVVVWHDLQSVLARRSPDGTLLIPGTAAWTTDLLGSWDAVLSRLTATGAKVAVLLPPLRSQANPGCVGATDLARCRVIQDQDTIIRAATESFAAQFAGRRDVLLVSVDDLLCPQGYPCPAMVDGLQVRRGGGDQTHFTDAGTAWFASRLFDRIATFVAGVGPAGPAASPKT